MRLTTTPENLASIGLTLLEPFTYAKSHTLMRCNNCNHEWSPMPFSTIKSHNDRGGNGCPECRREIRYASDRIAYLSKQPEYIQVLSFYDGRQGKGNSKSSMDHVHFRNTDCGHEFWTIPTDIFNRRVICPICGDQLRTAKRDTINQNRKTAARHTEWSAYKAEVRTATERSFLDHEQQINPDRHERSILGTPGGYQLDHILPQRIGFELNIPEELIGHPDNLQMILGADNRQHGAKLKDIPSIFDPYLGIILETYGVTDSDT